MSRTPVVPQSYPAPAGGVNLDPPDRLIDRVELGAILGFHPATIDKMAQTGEPIALPKPINIGARRRKWRLSTIMKLLADMEAAAQGPEVARAS
jgi:predicted DNA-binding transcriptional regulator AlpA